MSIDMTWTKVHIAAMTDEQENLVQRIEAVSQSSGLSAATICERAVRNSRLYVRLKAGGSCTYETGGKIHSFLDALEAQRNSQPPLGSE